MEKQRLDDLQKKASGFLGEGVRILRDSLKEAGRLINATADATKLHLEKEQRVLGAHRDYHRLGVELYRVVQDNANVTEFKINKTMKDIIMRIKHAEEEIGKSRERLSHMTVVNPPQPPVETKASNVRQVPRKPRRGGSAAPRKRKQKKTSSAR